MSAEISMVPPVAVKSPVVSFAGASPPTSMRSELPESAMSPESTGPTTRTGPSVKEKSAVEPDPDRISVPAPDFTTEPFCTAVATSRVPSFTANERGAP